MRKGCILCLVTLAAFNFQNSRFGDYTTECLEDNTPRYSFFSNRSSVNEKTILDRIMDVVRIKTRRPYYSTRNVSY